MNCCLGIILRIEANTRTLTQNIAFIAFKENIKVEGTQDIQTKVMVTLFALFAEVERDLISERTKEGAAKARASGKRLGRPKGSLGKPRLDGREGEIYHLLSIGRFKGVFPTPHSARIVFPPDAYLFGFCKLFDHLPDFEVLT